MSDALPQVKVFVIGPIGDRDESHGSPRRIIYEEGIQVLEQIIEPACTALGLEVLRADQITRTGEIPEQIFRQIRDAHIVIADLTGANPNVMYELGLRHTTGKLTIQIGERDRLPFDVSSIRTIMFKRSEGGLVEARRSLVQALANGLQSGGDPVAATRVWFESQKEIKHDGSSKEVADEENDEPGFLEKLVDVEEGIATVNQTLQTATSIILEISGIFSKEVVNAKDQTATVKLAIANRIADFLNEPANRLHITAIEYSKSLDRIEPGLKFLLNRLASDKNELAASGEFIRQMISFVDAASGSIDSVLEFKQTTDQTGNMARSMKQVNRRISTALQSFADSSQRVSNWRQLIDQLPTLETA
ncbi:MAG: hypothetical protein ACTFAK_05935 [Candidatus Electronema sp. VV]